MHINELVLRVISRECSRWLSVNFNIITIHLWFFFLQKREMATQLTVAASLCPWKLPTTSQTTTEETTNRPRKVAAERRRKDTGIM